MKRLAQLRELFAGTAFAALVLYAGGVTPLGRFAFEGAALLLALTVAAEWFASGHVALPNRLAFAATTGFVGYVLLRAFLPQPSGPSLDEAMYWVTGYILYSALVHHFRERERLERMIAWMAVVALIAAAIGFFTVYQAEGAEQPSVPGLWHLAGTYVNRNHFALLLVMLVPLTYYAGVAFRSASSTSDLIWERPWFLFLLSAALVIAFLLTGSVGGLMAFCVAAATIALDYLLNWAESSRRRLMEGVLGIALVVTLTLLWFGSDTLTSRLASAASGRELSALERIQMWKSALAMLGDYPAFGIGPGRFADYFPSYRPLEILYRVEHVHNDVLELTAEIGLAGAAILVVSIALYFLHVFSRRNEIRSIYDRAMVRGGTASLVALFVHSLLDFGMRLPANAFAGAAILAAVTASASHRQSDEPSSVRMSGWRRFAAGAFPVLGLLLFAAVSFARFMDSRMERQARQLLSGDPARAARDIAVADRYALLPSGRRENLRAKVLEAQLGGRPPAASEKQQITAAYDRAVEINPVPPDFWRDRAKWRLKAGDPQGAEADLIRAVELSPHDWRPLYELAVIQWQGGDPGGAIVNFGILLKDRPEHTGAILQAIASDPSRHAERLKALYPVISETFPETPSIRMQFGDHLKMFGLLDEAREQYERASNAEPENVQYLLRLADSLRAAGEYNGAIHRLDAFHEHSKGTPDSYEARGDLARQNQEVADAVAAYRKALDLEPDRPGTWRKLYDAYVEFQADPGIRFWQDLTERFPNRSVYQFAYAQELAKNPSTLGEATRELRLLAGREPSNWQVIDYLATLHVRRKLHEEARRVWADYADKNPLDPRPYEQIARMYDGLKLPDRAAEARALAEEARHRAQAAGK